MKSQGIPIDIIVIAVIGLIALVVVIGMFYGNFSSVFGRMFSFQESSTGSGIETIQSTCIQYCNSIPEFSTLDEFQSSRFCTAKFDTTKYNGISNDHCYDRETDEKLKVPCNIKSFTSSNCTIPASAPWYLLNKLIEYFSLYTN